MLTAVAVVALMIALFALIFLFLFPLARGAIWYPSTPEKTHLLAELAEVGPGDRAADLGSGDGRVVMALARRGAEAHGWEVNPILVIVSRVAIRRAGLADTAVIHWGSFWRADLSRFNAVVLFQGSAIMRRLEAKVRRELAPGTRVVSDYWGFPSLPARKIHGTVFCYRMGSFDGEA